MFSIVKDSLGLLLRGKLFADPGKAYRQIALGSLITALSMVILVRGAETPIWLAALVSGFIGGGLQPWLFRNLRYR